MAWTNRVPDESPAILRTMTILRAPKQRRNLTRGIVLVVWVFVLRAAYRTRAFDRYLGISTEP